MTLDGGGEKKWKSEGRRPSLLCGDRPYREIKRTQGNDPYFFEIGNCTVPFELIFTYVVLGLVEIPPSFV
jgi:hypothetical protein